MRAVQLPTRGYPPAEAQLQQQSHPPPGIHRTDYQVYLNSCESKLQHLQASRQQLRNYCSRQKRWLVMVRRLVHLCLRPPFIASGKSGPVSHMAVCCSSGRATRGSSVERAFASSGTDRRNAAASASCRGFNHRSCAFNKRSLPEIVSRLTTRKLAATLGYTYASAGNPKFRKKFESDDRKLALRRVSSISSKETPQRRHAATATAPDDRRRHD